MVPDIVHLALTQPEDEATQFRTRPRWRMLVDLFSPAQIYAHCEWCEQDALVSMNRVWSGADPVGRMVQLCQECVELCAAG